MSVTCSVNRGRKRATSAVGEDAGGTIEMVTMSSMTWGTYEAPSGRRHPDQARVEAVQNQAHDNQRSPNSPVALLRTAGEEQDRGQDHAAPSSTQKRAVSMLPLNSRSSSPA